MFKKPEYGATTTVNTMLMSIVLIVSIMHTSTLFARSHPFVFFTSEDIPALQAKVSQSGSRSKKAYDLFFTGTPTLDLQKMGGLKHEVFYQKQLLQVALKYTITGDTKYADRAISGIDRAMEMYNPDTFNWEDTGWAKGISDAQRKMVGSWLWGWGFGEVTRAVAVTYDIVYDQMTAAKRAQVLDWLERVCHHFKNNVNDGGRRDVLHNHTIPPYAAMAFTCWIIRDDTTDDMIKNQYPSYANDFVRRWYDKMYFQPNGNFTESALYTYFGADTCFSYSAALHINNEPDILSGTSAYNVLKFIGHGTMAYQEEDGFPILPGFGDNHERYNMTRYSCALVPILISQDPVQLFYYKHSIDDLNNMQSIANLTENNSIVNNNSLVNTVLFYPESLSERHPHDAGVSDGRLFLDRSGIGGSAALRSGWDLAGTGKDTVTAWFVNRYNRVNHNHHDMNALELAAYGEYFLIDPMHELYGSPRHGTSLGHNHIIIDDIGLPSSAARTGGCHADCSTLGEIHGFTSGDGGTVLRGDARYSYIDRLPIAEALDRKNIGQVTREDIDNHGGPLDKAERVFGLINGGNNPPYAIIIDEIKQDDATHKYDFRLHTYKSLSGLGTPANPFIADGTDADLYVTLIQPEAFTGSTGEYGERPSSARVENNNMIDAVQHEITGHFFAILYPRKNGMPNAAISSSAVENGVGAVVSWGSTGSDILLEKRSGSLVSYCNAVSGGRFASVRVQSGSVVSYLLLEGETLSYNGTTLISISGGGSASASVNGTIASVDAPGTSGFSVYAPAATTMLLNGSKISITHNGDYIVFGDGGPFARTVAADDWTLIFEENFADDSFRDRWHLEGFADLAVKDGRRARYLEIKTKHSADAPRNKQSVLWYKKRFAGDLRITFRTKGETGSRAILYFNARPSSASKRKSVLDWNRPDAQMVRYAGREELEMYSLGMLRDQHATCNLRHIGGSTAEIYTGQSHNLFDKESIFHSFSSPFSGKPDTWFEFDVQIMGASISLTMDGERIFCVEDTGNTKVGTHRWAPLTGGGWISFRNFAPTTVCIADLRVYQRGDGKLK